MYVNICFLPFSCNLSTNEETFIQMEKKKNIKSCVHCYHRIVNAVKWNTYSTATDKALVRNSFI
jgi:hypothetical protein